ncbi:MAG: hypothetical protein ACYTFK_02560 [Planctomycetota bacterium]
MNIKIGLVMAIFLLAVMPTVSIAEIIYVDADVPSSGNGTSWVTAFKYLQDALNKPPTNGDEIRMAQGIYTPAGAGGSRTSTFQLINGVTIKGGYAGLNEPDPNERDIDTHQTLLSGDLDGNDIGNLNDPSRNENSYHVVTGSGSSTTAELDGFTIIGGTANGPELSDHDKGGGIYNKNGNLILNDCTLTENSARNGTGLYNWVGTLTLTNCILKGNIADWDGSGILNYFGDLTLINCTFGNNSASNRGGGIYNHMANLTLTNCTFNENSATESAGGIWNYSLSLSYNATLTTCTFSGNSAINGGGIFNNHGIQTYTNCIFTGNSASTNGGAICNEYYCEQQLTNCIFTGNSANYGGGIYNYYLVQPTLTNCTFSVNSSSNGSSLACDGSTSYPSNVQLANCIFWDGEYGIWNNDESTITMNYSDFQSGWWGDGSNNIDADPCFVTGRLGDYYLSQTSAGQEANSLCVDAGNDTAANLGMDIFTTRTDQVVDTDAVDMGYHYPITNIADINGDWGVDFVDFAILATQWQQAPGIPSADIEPAIGNGIVDFLDIAVLVDNWLWRE